jgi:hypothetical protein
MVSWNYEFVDSLDASVRVEFTECFDAGVRVDFSEYFESQIVGQWLQKPTILTAAKRSVKDRPALRIGKEVLRKTVSVALQMLGMTATHG